MRTFFYISFLLQFSLATYGQVTISGTILNSPKQKAYLINVYGKRLDSAFIDEKHPSFFLKANITAETYLKILYSKKGPSMLNQFIILPDEHVKFTFDDNKADDNIWIDVSGSQRTIERITALRRIRELSRQSEILNHQVDSIRKMEPDTSVLESKKRLIYQYEVECDKIERNLFDSTQSPRNASLMLTFLRKNGFYNETKQDSLIRALQTRFPNDKDIQSLTNNNNNSEEQGLPLNAKAPPIILKDAGGQEIELAKLNAKYIFIDFWASWCKPCRDESPNLVKAYNDFKSKGLQILSVSIDANTKLWTEAIKKDGTSDFIQVIDTRAAKSTLLRDYKLISIPASFLVDKNGIIIAKNLRGDELYKLIDKLTR